MKQMVYCPYCGKFLSPQSINGRDYPACRQPDCDYIFWNNPLPVVAGLVKYEDKILLANHRDAINGILHRIPIN